MRCLQNSTKCRPVSKHENETDADDRVRQHCQIKFTHKLQICLNINTILLLKTEK